MDKSYWLKEGTQTEITDLVKTHALEIRQIQCRDIANLPALSEPEVILAYKTGQYIISNIKRHPIYNTIKNIEKERKEMRFESKTEEEKYNSLIKTANDVFCRQRTADDILMQGRFGFCSDKAILFRALMLAQGIPVSYIEAAKTFLLAKKEDEFKPHATTKVYAKNQTFIYDPMELQGFDCEMTYFEKDNGIIIREGLDSWDMGIKSKRDSEIFLRLFAEEIRQKSKETDSTIYSTPAFV